MKESELLNVELDSLSNKELTKYVNLLIKEIQPKASNLKRLKNAEEKGKINKNTAAKIKQFENKIGKYSRGAKAGEYKSVEKLSKKDRVEIARIGRSIIRQDIYSKKGREWQEKRANKIFDIFKEDVGREDYTRQDFDNLTYIYNVLGKKLSEEYGSENVMEAYETIKESGVDIDNPTYTISSIIERVSKMGLTKKEMANKSLGYIMDILDNERSYEDIIKDLDYYLEHK